MFRSQYSTNFFVAEHHGLWNITSEAKGSALVLTEAKIHVGLRYFGYWDKRSRIYKRTKIITIQNVLSGWILAEIDIHTRLWKL
jgi:hypothetical protein